MMSGWGELAKTKQNAYNLIIDESVFVLSISNRQRVGIEEKLCELVWIAERSREFAVITTPFLWDRFQCMMRI